MTDEIRIAYLLALAAMAVEHFAQLKRSDRNARFALGLGGVEYQRARRIAMRGMPLLLLASCGAEVVLFDRSFEPLVGIPMLLVAFACQIMRWSTIRALGDLWTTRIIVVPQLRPVTGGPYRWIRHPHDSAMMLEGIAIPMMHDAWLTALAFSIVNVVVLRDQIRVEEAALTEHSDYATTMKDRGSLWPRFRHSSGATI